MKRALALTSVLVVATGGGPEASAPQTETAPSTSADEEAPTADAQVEDWLDRAASAPHNGMNPELALPPELLRDGAAAFQQAIATGAPQRRHDAASALARHPEPASQRAFWLTQLASEDPIVRFYASTSIADVHAAEDFEPFVRATFGRGDLLTLAARARDFGDRRAVPPLVDSLGGDRGIAVDVAWCAGSPGRAARPRRNGRAPSERRVALARDEPRRALPALVADRRPRRVRDRVRVVGHDRAGEPVRSVKRGGEAHRPRARRWNLGRSWGVLRR